MVLDVALIDGLEELTAEVNAWSVLTCQEKARLETLLEAYMENEQVDPIYASLASLGLDESEFRKYLKKADVICNEIEEGIPNLLGLSHRERGRTIFDRIWSVFIVDASSYRYKLTEVLDTGIGSCNSLSGLVGGIMQRFGLNVVFRHYTGPTFSHVNIGLYCKDEEGKPLLKVEPTSPTGYNCSNFDEILRLTRNWSFYSSYDSRVLCSANLGWRSLECEEFLYLDDFSNLRLHPLRFNLIAHQFTPDRPGSLLNIAFCLYELDRGTSSDVGLMKGLTDYVLNINPVSKLAVDLLSKVRERYG